MSTLFDALLETAQLSGITTTGKTTSSGATTYIVDKDRYENDNYYANGTLFITSGSYANSSKRIVSYASSTGVITFTPSCAGAVPVDVFYTITNVPRGALVQAINQALLFMGEQTLIDETLAVTNNKTEYDLPAGVSNLKRVEVFTATNAPYGLNPVTTWREFSGKLYLPAELSYPPGRTMRLYYNKHHPHVYSDTDAISDNYNLKRLAWTATYMYILNRMQYGGNNDERENVLLELARQQAERLRVSFPVHHIERDPILARW